MRLTTFLLALSCAAMTLSAQTNVVKRQALKSNDYGVAYTLPKTVVVASAVVAKTTYKPGPYYTYADRLLQIKEPIVEAAVEYEMTSLKISTKGVPNADASYRVEFKAGTTAPYVYLTEDNLLCAINTDVVESVPAAELLPANVSPVAIDPSLFNEDMLQAGSTFRVAELCAKKIYDIRERRNSILMGENTPPDGEALKQVMKMLDEQEAALLAQFKGTTAIEYSLVERELPAEAMEQQLIFRFSKHLGIVEADDLSGTPIYLSIEDMQTTPKLEADAKTLEKRAKQKGVRYNVPGKGAYTLMRNGAVFTKGEIDIVQFGMEEILAPEIFEDKKNPVKISFYPELGAIQEINLQ